MLTFVLRNCTHQMVALCGLTNTYNLSLVNSQFNSLINQNTNDDLKIKMLNQNYCGSWLYTLNIYPNLKKITICHMYGLFLSWRSAMYFLPPKFVQEDDDLFVVNMCPILMGGNAKIWWDMLKKVRYYCIFVSYIYYICYIFMCFYIIGLFKIEV